MPGLNLWIRSAARQQRMQTINYIHSPTKLNKLPRCRLTHIIAVTVRFFPAVPRDCQRTSLVCFAFLATRLQLSATNPTHPQPWPAPHPISPTTRPVFTSEWHPPQTIQTWGIDVHTTSAYMSGPRLPLLDLLPDCDQIPPLPLRPLRLSSPPLPRLAICID